MKSAGMTGWGYATKITPQGENYASFMSYDAFDSMYKFNETFIWRRCSNQITRFR